jgi:hypothetical protein
MHTTSYRKFKFSVPDSTLLRKISFVLLGASFGLLYGMVTMQGDIAHGCYGSRYEGMCGVMTGILNYPGSILGTAISSVGQSSLYRGFWSMLGVLFANAIICGFFAYITQLKFRKFAIPVLIFLFVIFILGSLFPIFFFR